MNYVDIILLAAPSLPIAGLGLILLLTRPHYAIAGIFLLAFTGGIPELFGVEQFYVKLLIEISILILFLSTFWLRSRFRKPMIFPGAWWMVFLAATCIISFMINPLSVLQFMNFIRIMFIPYIFFVTVVNLPWQEKDLTMVLKTIFFLYLIQLLASIIKLATVGPQEAYIGTISYYGGSITTVLVLLATAYLAVLYAETEKINYIFLLIGFIGFGMIGQKRALICFVPIIWFLSAFLHGRQKGSKNSLGIFLRPKNLRNIAIALIGGLVVFYSTVRLNPSLNPEGISGGSFDINFLINYSIGYNTHEGRDTSRYIGRLSAPKHVWALVATHGLQGKIFGLGPGILAGTRFVEGSSNYLSNKLKIGYGGRNGIWFLLIQVGLLGLCTQFGFMFYLLGAIERILGTLKNRYHICLSLVTQISIVIYFFDTTTYSNSMHETHAMFLPVMWLSAVLIRLDMDNNVVKSSQIIYRY
jgi:hypothetical protein